MSVPYCEMDCFTTTQAFWERVVAARDEVIVFRDVCRDDYNALLKDRGANCRIRFRRYDAENQILVVVVGREVYEKLGHLSLEIIRVVRDMGVWNCWHYIEVPQGEPDTAMGPDYQDRPTLIIEAGTSLAALRSDMEWWFANDQTEIGVLVRLDSHAQTILLEKWEGDTRDTITIHEKMEGEEKEYVASGDLHFAFDTLFRRRPNPLEGDIVVPAERLERWAARVFNEMRQ